jgi:DNA-binding Lrp family transcriptional regulator
MTNANLASAVGLSASPCLQRVKRLEAAGIISGYGAHLNLAKLTSTVTVFTEIMLHDHRRDDFTRFEANLRDFDEIKRWPRSFGQFFRFLSGTLGGHAAVFIAGSIAK